MPMYSFKNVQQESSCQLQRRVRSGKPVWVKRGCVSFKSVRFHFAERERDSKDRWFKFANFRRRRSSTPRRVGICSSSEQE